MPEQSLGALRGAARAKGEAEAAKFESLSGHPSGARSLFLVNPYLGTPAIPEYCHGEPPAGVNFCSLAAGILSEAPDKWMLGIHCGRTMANLREQTTNRNWQRQQESARQPSCTSFHFTSHSATSIPMASRIAEEMNPEVSDPVRLPRSTACVSAQRHRNFANERTD